LQGPDKGRTFHTGKAPAVIGRASDQIQLSDVGTSRRHAEIRYENGVWVLGDLKSSNGTYLNGQRLLRPATLKNGDQIKVGGTLLVFSGEDHIGGFSGADVIQDLVDMDAGATRVGSSILSTVDSQSEGIILPAPETADAVAAWNVMFRVAEAVGTMDAVDAFLTRVCDLLFEHLVVDRLVLLLSSDGSENFTPHIVRYRSKEREQRPKITPSRRIIGHVVRTGEGVLCANAMTDARFGAEGSADSIHRLGLQSVICAPILIRGEVEGIIHLDCEMSRNTFTQEQLRLVVAIGRLCGLAIENRRLLEARMRTERLAATGETVAYLSHHIRNILQGLQGGAEVVEIGFQRNSLETARSGWALIRKNLDRTYHLALNMLTFSKDRRPSIEPTPINRVVEDVISLCRHRAEEKGIVLAAELGDVPLVPMDAEGIHQVIHNIVLNAVDAAPRGQGRVEIMTRHDQAAGRVIVSVADNGPGIPEAERGKIFSVFHSSKGHAGTGLGLAAAKKIVDEIHGDISVENEEGKGTKFRVVLHAGGPAVVDQDRTHTVS
jgi:two-component system NtrC family sensor kinase